MKTLRGWTMNDDGQKWDVRARAPSNSRMAIHQWPPTDKSFKQALPLVIEAAEKALRENPNIGIGLRSKIDVNGVSIKRAHYEDGKGFIEMTCGPNEVAGETDS